MIISVLGEEIHMSGRVDVGDLDKFRSLLDDNPNIKTVIFGDSTGGDAQTGYDVGDLIRQRGLNTIIKGSCVSSCSRMWLGGIKRTLDGANACVGLHGNYYNEKAPQDIQGKLKPDAPEKLRKWLPQKAPKIDLDLMQQWINLPINKDMMYFYNNRALLRKDGMNTPILGSNVLNAGLSTEP